MRFPCAFNVDTADTTEFPPFAGSLILVLAVCFRALDIPEDVKALAQERDFELIAYGFDAAGESLRAPRTVRIGAIQNKIVLPTMASIPDQVRPDERARQSACANSFVALFKG